MYSSKLSPALAAIWHFLLLAPQAITSPVPTHKSLATRDTIPSYALTYAPYTHLYSGEKWWPSDIAIHVQHVTPKVNYAPVASNVTLENLNTFSTDTYLTSDDNVADSPDWLLSAYGMPDSAGYSTAPATIIVAPKNDCVVDVFYFYFYSYNRGNSFADIEFGDHVGDWEHTMIRFINEVPTYVFLSEHSSGAAYNYSVLPQNNSRPVTYIAVGTHANYATVGKQNYEPISLDTITDTTDAGLYWDVTANYRGFFYDNSTGTFTSAGGADIGGSEQAAEGTGWLTWLGAWGDEQYPDNHSGQYCVFGECHYVSGPTGPLSKNLWRVTVCEDQSKACDIQTSLKKRDEGDMISNSS
ncbi:hypothetical protein BP5796_03003 [Coleophoma crateriformis]|uniref:Vacuolar protein sorting-associated protein 62 n=1 Tax=Coleophoma crateriformis TaxID=565419 RepID=A0A3D8SLT8_9HELO|nr:hypothetical protein BP5796_03003 [Coleophoma crateriformis]